jgi:hypothetical protein
MPSNARIGDTRVSYTVAKGFSTNKVFSMVSKKEGGMLAPKLVKEGRVGAQEMINEAISSVKGTLFYMRVGFGACILFTCWLSLQGF